MAWRTALGAATEARHSSVAGERSSIHNNTAGACLAVGRGDHLVQYQPLTVTRSRRQEHVLRIVFDHAGGLGNLSIVCVISTQ